MTDLSKATLRPTPYDAEEVEFQQRLEENGGEASYSRTAIEEWHRAWRLGAAEGYRQALDSDQAIINDLVAALEAIRDSCDDPASIGREAWAKLDAALAKAKGVRP